MNPHDLIRLLMQQLGRVPSLEELYAAMGLGGAVTPSEEAGAQDPRLTMLLRQNEAMSSQVVRMMLLGSGSSPFGLPRGYADTSSPSRHPGHVLPHVGLS